MPPLGSRETGTLRENIVKIYIVLAKWETLRESDRT